MFANDVPGDAATRDVAVFGVLGCPSRGITWAPRNGAPACPPEGVPGHFCISAHTARHHLFLAALLGLPRLGEVEPPKARIRMLAPAVPPGLPGHFHYNAGILSLAVTRVSIEYISTADTNLASRFCWIAQCQFHKVARPKTAGR